MAILAGDLSSAVPYYEAQKNKCGRKSKIFAEYVISVA